MTTEQLQMISTNPQVMHGQAVIAGTRVPVSVVLDCLAGGMAADEITAEYPSLTPAGCAPLQHTAQPWPARNYSRYRRPGEIQTR